MLSWNVWIYLCLFSKFRSAGSKMYHQYSYVFFVYILYDSDSSYCILYSTIAINILSSTLLMKSDQLKIP